VHLLRERKSALSLGALPSVALGVAVLLLLAPGLPVGESEPPVGLSAWTLHPGLCIGQNTLFAPSSTVPLTWTELLTEGLPPSNLTSTPVLVYDPLTLQVLDFVGTPEAGLTSVWGFSAGVWTNVTPAGNLTHQDLTEFSATFDSAEGYLLLFGYIGYSDEVPAQAETWSYSAGTWTELNLTSQPEGESMAGVTYDPVESSVILLTAPIQAEDAITWEFQGRNWTELATASSPPALFGSTMAFDNSSADQEVVLFADGIQPTGPTLGFWNQTWVFRGAEWLNVTATSGPAPVAAEGAMTYDASEQELLLVDGGSFANSTPARTWDFTNGRWAYLATPSSAPFIGDGGSNFAYDPHDGYALFVGAYYSDYSGTSPETMTQTWKFDRTDIGPPPSLALNVTPRNVTVGGSVHVTARATGGFGALALRVVVALPGLMETEGRNGSWNFTTTESGFGVVALDVSDQSGRAVQALREVNVTSSSSPPGASPLFEVVEWAGIAAAVTLVAVILSVLLRRRARRPPAGVGPSTPSPGGRSP
jgi:hypothetical protein